MRPSKHVGNVLIAATALVFAGGRFIPNHDHSGPVLTKAVAFITPKPAVELGGETPASAVRSALGALGASVQKLSHPAALESAFRSYFAYKSEHPADVQKPYLYFVDYGLPATTPRGYVFDMASLRVIEGPFMVAAGRGSTVDKNGVPVKFSNASGSAATSLGLYVARSTYQFTGKSAGHRYSSIGLRLDGVSSGFNDNALARGVVAHGAPYVTPTRAGRSEGCPAMEQTRAKELLPKLANGAMVFLFAPDPNWMANDPWLAATVE
jgi:L,D-transpeptidase-like protein